MEQKTLFEKFKSNPLFWLFSGKLFFLSLNIIFSIVIIISFFSFISSFFVNEYKDPTNKAQALVLTYNFDRLEGEELENQIIRFGVNVPSILNDPGALFGWESPPSLPATYVLDPEGKLIHTLIGPQTQESLEALIMP